MSGKMLKFNKPPGLTIIEEWNILTATDEENGWPISNVSTRDSKDASDVSTRDSKDTGDITDDVHDEKDTGDITDDVHDEKDTEEITDGVHGQKRVWHITLVVGLHRFIYTDKPRYRSILSRLKNGDWEDLVSRRTWETIQQSGLLEEYILATD